MQATRLTLAAVTVALCLAVVSTQSSFTWNEEKRWKDADSEIRLLVRKVDDDHPYFRSMTYRLPKNASESLTTLSRMLSKHCNTTNITRLVKNDLLILESNDDVQELQSGDKIEIWSNSSGEPTRAVTVLSSAGPNQLRPCRFTAQEISSGSNLEGRGPWRGGRGPRGRGREERRKGGNEDDDRRGPRRDGRGPHGRGRDEMPEGADGDDDRRGPRRDGRGPHGRGRDEMPEGTDGDDDRRGPRRDGGGPYGRRGNRGRD